ncbi:MAG TPA: hypothetical protein VNO50_02865 [Pyrinomonadaceae bacterium]|nr:hypothetical protein [Pyrinomonadaceae bacterium]
MSVFPSLLLHNSRRSIKLYGYIIAGIALLTAAMESGASAQSGRRGTPKPAINSSSGAIEPNNSTPVETAKVMTGLQLPKVKLLFARQLTSKHLQNEDVIAASFFKRLTDFINVDCTSIGDLKQAQARARAKSERDAFVVLLKFDMNNYQSGTILLDSPDLEVEYFAFAPRTGKKHVKGKVYFQTIGSGRMQKSGWPNGTPIRITPEAAGIEAAETLHHLLLAKAPAAKTRP